MLDVLDEEVLNFIYIHRFGGRAEVTCAGRNGTSEGLHYVIKLLDADDKRIRISKNEFDKDFAKYTVKDVSLEEKMSNLKVINDYLTKINDLKTKELNQLRKENGVLKNIIKNNCL